jgi:C-terminal of Roc, COR, domain/Ras of Complex, Roc, domain of DAPkinase/Leucine rich repeat
MARNKAYRRAEEKIEEARRSGTKELNLRGWEKDSEQLTELPESLSQLTQLQLLELPFNQLTALPESFGQLTQLQSLDLSKNRLATLPESFGQLTQLQSVDLSRNELTALPESLGQLTQLQSLNLSKNQLTALPKSLGQLTQLRTLDLSKNQLTALPNTIGALRTLEFLLISGNRIGELPTSFSKLDNLRTLYLGFATEGGGNEFKKAPTQLRQLKKLQGLIFEQCQIQELPDWFSELSALELIWLEMNQLRDLPASLEQLHLLDLQLDDNPLNPELAAADSEGIDAVQRYLRAKAEARAILNEAKLILIGEGEVGKSCLLGALRGDPWEDGRPMTHGIEIKSVKVTDPATSTEITLNGWDFGGQRVYRPTHQLFFSSPALYLVVWKPREGPQQGFVKEWIKLVKHREPDAKILVVATHDGPKERQPDIDRQEIWDLFGKDTVIDFFHVDSKPQNDEKGTCKGINDLKDTIATVAASLPEVGRSVPKRWQDVRETLKQIDEAYLPLHEVLAICAKHKMSDEEAQDFVRISHRLGHLIHYGHDPRLKEMVILKPDWLATAVSFVLDDEETRNKHGLVKFTRLGELWSDNQRDKEFRYHPKYTRFLWR